MSFCDFVVEPAAGGRYAARCRLCGRSVLAKSESIVAACRASADYQRTNAIITRGASGDGGPGSELKKLLSRWLGIVAGPGCACERHALAMDLWGPDECERRIDEIVGWLRDEHAKRREAGDTRIPWTDFGAAQLVKLACRRARAKAGL